MEIKELPLVIPTSKRDEVDKQMWSREDHYFASNLWLLSDSEAIEFENSEQGKNTMNAIRGTYYHNFNAMREHISGLIKKNCSIGEKNDNYIWYMIQKQEIEEMKMKSNVDSTKSEMLWSKMEPADSKDHYIFFFHCYLKYLQANDIEAKNAGARAQDIVKLAHYMLDGEMKANEKEQNEVYGVISKELELTEEEFEALFTN